MGLSKHGGDDSLPLRPEAPPKKQRSVCGCFSAIGRRVGKHIYPKAVKEMFDFRQRFWPFTWKKSIVRLRVAAAVAGIVVSEHYTHWIEKSMTITRRNMLPVLVIVLGLEPAMITIILLVARVPDLDPIDAALHVEVEAKNEKVAMIMATDLEAQKNVRVVEISDDHRMALVILCHNSDREATKKVLVSAYTHFRPQYMLARVSGSSGAVAGFFTYINDTDESDTETLTRDLGDASVHYSNQPPTDDSGATISGSTYNETLPSGRNSSEWNMRRLDWQDRACGGSMGRCWPRLQSSSR